MTPTYTLQEAAKFLGIGAKRLFARLRREHVLNEKNLPYQAFIDRGLLLVEARRFERWDGGYQSYGRTRVSAKGLDWLKALLAVEAQAGPGELKDRLNQARVEILQIACHCIKADRAELGRALREAVADLTRVMEALEK